MKKLLILFFFLLFAFLHPAKLQARTGHDAFSRIDFKDEGKLLVDMTSEEIEDGYQVMKRKFWGWRHHYFNIFSEATYIGEVIFSKSNRTRQPLEIHYVLQEKDFTERSITVSGSISGKIDGKLQKGNLGGNVSAQASKKETDSYTRIEETEFDIIVEPNYRIIFHITGDCEITNGVSKYYVLGIVFNKGSWEYVNILTRYYEFLEEKLEV
ncbi:MAG: hypothetical protein GX661_02675 [Acholeplasmataceae bacterium]|nr:hypothetical protein [Acholeplasmataceae bacterium]